MCTTFMPGTGPGQKRVSDLLELELQIGVGGLKENSPPKGVALFGGVVLFEEGVTVGVDFEVSYMLKPFQCHSLTPMACTSTCSSSFSSTLSA